MNGGSDATSGGPVNMLRHAYIRDRGDEPGHRREQPLIGRINYAHYGDRDGQSFLVSVSSDYEPRPDPRSGRRAGLEIRTSLPCRAIRTATHAADGVARAVREYRFACEQVSVSGVTLLARLDVVGVDDTAGTRPLPPEAGRRFEGVARHG